MRIPFTNYQIKFSRIILEHDKSYESIAGESRGQDDGVPTNFWIPFFISIFIVFLIFIYYWTCWANSQYVPDGDSFGPLTSLFTGLAFAGLIATLWVQRQDIKVTQQEMKKSVTAQQDMASKMEKELTFARISSNLELLNKYISMVEKGSQTPLGNISRTIITKLTEDLIMEPSFLYAVTPRFSVHKGGHKTPPMTKEGYEFSLIISAEKLPIEIIECVFNPMPTDHHKIKSLIGKVIMEGQNIRDVYNFNDKTFTFEITVKDSILKNKWRRKYNIDLSGITILRDLLLID
ncbi:MAG TPA: hypothetical protein VFG10_07210 [Saprospiraceae bacterium]|nr:hypothetical protein [Saprospiraceae bacterium]